ncbi:MAG: class I SAM-dependent methyltransferase [Clostridia bacterium]|nr:class I SAM-dependent methyltransferase [Clostridia bacterium]
MYGELADLYDGLNRDQDPEEWAAYLLRLMALAGVSPRTAVDAGCGTGRIAVAMAQRGIRVTGMDLSERMLWRAQENARRAGVQIPFAQMDMRSIEVHRPVDAVFAACDGVNYLTDNRSVSGFFHSAWKALRPGGVLVFDISSAEKLAGMDGQLYFQDLDGVSLFWQNALEDGILRMELTFFVEQDGGLYRRFDEIHRQRLFRPEALKELLARAGFGRIRVFGDRKEEAPAAGEARLFFLAVRPPEGSGVETGRSGRNEA